jgi:hypothetical protein
VACDREDPRLQRAVWFLGVARLVDSKQGFLANVLEFVRIRDTAAQKIRNCWTDFVDERAKGFAITVLRTLHQRHPLEAARTLSRVKHNSRRIRQYEAIRI